MTGKDAFERLRETPLYHEEHSEDENLHGEMVTSFWTEYDGTLDEVHTELCDAVKKDLKALDILKRWVVVEETGDDLFPYDISVRRGYVSSGSVMELSKEEYGLLKEWLNEK